MIQTILSKLGSIKATLSTYVVGTLILIVGTLAILLRKRSKQLHLTQLKLLKLNSDITLDALDQTKDASMARADKAAGRFYEALQDYFDRYRDMPKFK